MGEREHQRPPWVRERPPWVAEPTPAGLAVLRQWLDVQLALVTTRRRHRRRLGRHRR